MQMNKADKDKYWEHNSKKCIITFKGVSKDNIYGSRNR